MGESVSATKPETTTAPASASANSANRRPVRPGVKAKGAYTAAKVSVMATMAKPISRAPLIAASNGFMPSSIWRKMFSSTTIASSTTRPMASTMASRVSVLIEKPNRYISAQAPTSDTGMVTMGMMLARRLRRKKKITSTTRAMASPMVWNTESMERSINTDESYAMFSFMPAGRFSFRRATSSRAALDSSSGLAVDCRVTPMLIAGLPLKRDSTRSLAAAISTLETSRRRTG
ncbi:hypothetical protein D9M68_642060 [compost metagenome]